jgi:hypothetical protein
MCGSAQLETMGKSGTTEDVTLKPGDLCLWAHSFFFFCSAVA